MANSDDDANVPWLSTQQQAETAPLRLELDVETVGARQTSGRKQLLAGRIGDSPDVGVTQVLQHRFFIVAHAASEIRIIQPLVSRRFRHVLQHTQLLFHHLLAVPRHLLPLGQDIVLDVIPLFRRQISPSLFILAQLCLLLRRHVIPLVELLADLVLLVRREILKSLAVLQNSFSLCGCQVPHGIDPRFRRAHASLLALVQVRALAIRRTVFTVEIRVRCIIGLRRTVIALIPGRRRAIRICRRPVRILFLRVCLGCLRRRGMGRRRRRRVRLLRPGIPGQRDISNRGQKHYTELNSLAHLPASLLISFLTSLPVYFRSLHLLLGIRNLFRLHRGWQFLQRLKVGKHIVIFENRQILHHLLVSDNRVAPGQR